VTELEREIRSEIAARGPMSFERFMSLALYHPELGYYRSRHDPFGIAGDYYTSSQLQPVFGRLIADQIARWRLQAGSAAGFTTVELGAGRGETAREIRSRLPEVPYIEVEHRMGDLPEHMTGVIFSNEFFDALPVHVVRCGEQGILERFVGLEEGKLTWVEAEPSSPAIVEYVQRFAPALARWQVIEVNLEALKWTERIASSLDRGWVVTIDYGYTADEIAGGKRFPEGSLMSYYRHSAYEDVLRDPGERDITAHVNFTALAEYGDSLGLRALPLQTQAQFLLSIGQADGFDSAVAGRTQTEVERHRLQLKTLLYGMGETFRVLVQEKL